MANTQAKHTSFENIDIHVTSQFTENSERLNLFKPTGQQLAMKHSDGSFILVSEVESGANKKELRMLWQVQGKGSLVAEENAQLPSYDSLLGMKTIYAKDETQTLLCMVMRNGQKSLEHMKIENASNNSSKFKHNWEKHIITNDFDYWDIEKNEKGEIVVLFGSEKQQPFLVNIATNTRIDLQDIDLEEETVQKQTLSLTKDTNDLLSATLVKVYDVVEEDDYSRLYVSSYRNGVSYFNNSIDDSGIGIPLITNVISKELAGKYYTFLITEGDDDTDESISQVHLFSVNTSASEGEQLITQKVLEISGKINDITPSFINYHENELHDNYDDTRPSLFIETTYTDDGNTSKHLLKCDPITDNDELWQVATYLPNIKNAQIHYNPQLQQTDIFCVKSSDSALPHSNTNKQDVIEYVSIDNETSLFETKHVNLKAENETKEVLIHTTSTYFYFNPENDEIKLPLDKKTGKNYMQMSATGKCTIIVDGNYYDLKPNQYENIPLAGDNSIAILYKNDTVNSPNFIFSTPNSTKALRYRTSYLADEKIKNTATSSNDDKMNVLHQANQITGKLGKTEAFTIVNKENASAHNLAFNYLKNNSLAQNEDFFFAVDFSNESPQLFSEETQFQNHIASQAMGENFHLPKIISDIVKKAKKIAGDVIHTLKKAADYVGKIVIKSVEKGFQVLLHIGDDIISAVVKTFEAAWAVVSNIAKKIWKAIKDVVKFLGYLFNLHDFIETKNKLKNTVNSSFDFMIDITKKDSILRQDIHTLAGNIEAYLEGFKSKKMEGKKSDKDKYHDKQAAFRVLPETGHVKDQMHRNNNDTGIPSEFSVQINAHISTLAAIAPIESGIDFSAISDLVKEAGVSQGKLLELFTKVKDVLIQMIIDAVKGVETILNKILDVICGLVTVIKEILNYDLTTIPFMGPLLKDIVGSSFSFLDIICFALAIPVTIISKLVKELHSSSKSSITAVKGSLPILKVENSKYNSRADYCKVMDKHYLETQEAELKFSVKFMISLISEMYFLTQLTVPLKNKRSKSSIVFGILGFGYGCYKLRKGVKNNDEYEQDMGIIKIVANTEKVFNGFRTGKTKDKVFENKVWLFLALAKMTIPFIYLMKDNVGKDKPVLKTINKAVVMLNNTLAFPFRKVIAFDAPLDDEALPILVPISLFLRAIEVGDGVLTYVEGIDD